MNEREYDVVVIGAGPGGYTAALRAAAQGKRVAIVEKDSIGGVCLNEGCIPTKAMLASSAHYRSILSASNFGISTERVSFNYDKIIQRRNAAIEKLRSGIHTLISAQKIDIIQGTASFTSTSSIEVKKANERISVAFHNAIIATGSRSVLPASFPTSNRVLDSTGFLKLNTLPNSLLVVGGGVLGCEFATFAAELGCRVTIVEARENILPSIDGDMRDVLRESLVELGVEILTGNPISNIETDDDGVYATVGDKEVFADSMLVAVGRIPNVEELGLDAIGIRYNATGVATDAQCRTNLSAIYAVGDVESGSTQLAADAMEHGRIAADAACGNIPHRARLTPTCIFTHPEIASAGISEQRAATLGILTKIEKSYFKHNGMAVASGDSNGFVKRIYDASTGNLIGIGIVGPNASELISFAASGLEDEFIAPHPTLAEAIFK